MSHNNPLLTPSPLWMGGAFLCLCAFLLTACANSEIPLPGERELVFYTSGNQPARPEQPVILPASEVRLPPPSRNQAWSQQGGNAAHMLIHPALARGVEGITDAPVFDVSAGSASAVEVVAQPVMAEGKLFVLDGRLRVRAFDAESGTQIWQQALTTRGERTSSGIGGGVAFADGVLYVATGVGTAAALNPDDGAILWREQSDHPYRAAPVADESFAFFTSHDNRVSARLRQNGQEGWSHQGIQETTRLFNAATPALAGDIILVAYSSGEFHALRRENGTHIWSAQITESAGDALFAIGAAASPVADGDRIISVQANGPLRTFSLRDGRTLWSRQIGSLMSPVIAGAYLYILDSQNYLLCLDVVSGATIWARPLSEFVPEEEQSAEVIEDNIRWHGPVLASDTLFFTSSKGDLLALDAGDGALLATRKFSGGFASAPIIADGAMFLLTRSMRLMRLN